MPLALPGYVDCGLTGYFSGSATIEQMMAASTPFGASGLYCDIMDWRLTDDSRATGAACPVGQAEGSYGLTVRNTILGVPLTTVYTESFGCTAVTGSGVKKFYSTGWTESRGPFRLGMTRGPIGATQYPNFFTNYITRFHWFVDENTQLNSSCAGITAPTYWMQPSGFYGPTKAAPFTPIDVGVSTGDVRFGAFVVGLGVASEEQARFSGISVNGISPDTSNLVNGCLRGSGGGNVIASYTGSNRGDSNSCGGPYHFTETVDVFKFGGASSGATVTDADGVDRSCPAQYERSWYTTDWGGTTYQSTRSISIKSSWATAHDPSLGTTDLAIPYFSDPPRLNKTGGPDVDYLPVSVTLAAEVDVQRPDGNRPSDWVSSDTNKMTVAEGSAATVFTVDQAGPTATRTLAVDWKNRVGLMGTGDPLFFITAYERTRHQAGEDIWGWNAYAFLRVRITSPKDTALILTLNGTTIAVNDTHETDLAARIAAYTVTPTAWTKTYAISARAGTADYDLDLLFPNEGPRPFYPDRIDSLTLSGFQVGTYTLASAKLVAKGPSYLKWGWGRQVQREDYSAWGLAVDGAFVYGKVPDQAQKPDEIGDTGGSIRYVNPVTGTGTGTITDNQYTLEQLCSILNNQEGLAVTYSQAAHDAAMKDPYGGDFGAEIAQDMKPLVPYAALTPGTAYQPDCAVISRQIQITTLFHFSLVAHLQIYGGLEALVRTPEGERVGDGLKINAVRTDTGATVASGLTDRFGYVITSPVPANGSRLYGLQADEEPQPAEASVALRPRDLVRLPIKVGVAESGPWPLEVRTQQYHRAHTRSGRVEYRRANHVVPPFDYGSSPTEGLQPRMCRDHRGRVRLFYAERPLPLGNVWQIISDDDGRTFGSPSVVMPGAGFPSITYDPRTQTVFATFCAGGTLYGWRERPNETAFPYSLGVAVEEDVAHACPFPGSPGVWLLACRILDEGAISLWRSTDDGVTWLRIATGLPGHTHPHVMADPLGVVLIAGYKDNQLAGALLYPGETSFRAAHSFISSGAALQVADTTFGIAVAHENPQRWVLATRIVGESRCSEWFSADLGRTWTRVNQ